ncbi:hypothetical protein Ciccas_008398 [Cichlidogyrus casuarinus]|uniref:Mediator of RNA polymerase II transcription subunit 30 n=1 Tax=Cichlidogyrus casuarinus TaxID=1844966 RepID=A0ABD2Q019_9PLAT
MKIENPSVVTMSPVIMNLGLISQNKFNLPTSPAMKRILLPPLVKNFDLPVIETPLPLTGVIDPSPSTDNIIECRNDIENRRKKMKKHKKRKWMRKYIALEQRNPVLACKQGQEEIQIFTDNLIRLMTELLKVNDPRLTPSRAIQSQTVGLQRHIEEIGASKARLLVEFETVRDFLAAHNLTNATPKIPYMDEPEVSTKIDPQVEAALVEKERLSTLLSHKHQQLEHLNDCMQKAIWEINDLTDPTLKTL